MGIIKNESIDSSFTLLKYKDTLKRVLKLSYPHLNDNDFDDAINYSIQKRYYKSNATLYNNYTNTKKDLTLLELTDYINSREPICTAYGVLFKKHGAAPNPMIKVIQGFLDKRSEDKKMMFTFPKGSEDFEKYNLLQQLDKIDANGIYGVLGLYVSLLYNLHVATSITAQGRSLISSATMCFEMFLANNVKFGSLNEVIIFIDNILSEKNNRKFDDRYILDKNKFINAETCFAKIVMTCGYKWIPNEDELDIIWSIIRNLDQEDLNRIYYKNNLYEFMENSTMINGLRLLLTDLQKPYMNPSKPPKEIIGSLDGFTDILMEYVYYGYQIIDRTDRCEQMIKSICLISDTDSAIISLDAWYRFALEKVKDIDMPILHQNLNVINYIETEELDNVDPTYKNLLYSVMERDEYGDITDSDWKRCIEFEDPVLDYNFYDDTVIEKEREINCIEQIPQDNLRYSILNILAYVLDKVINAYMIDFTKQSHSYRGDSNCRIIMKNEYLFKRVLLTMVKKNYASIQEIQEGNFLGDNGVLDIKGIAALAKSSMSEFTRKELTKILYEDILIDKDINQLKVIKKMAILENKIYNSLKNGKKDFYKPVAIKGISNYEDPMKIQGIKASVAWNELRDKELEAINLSERNSIDIAKVIITDSSIEKIKEEFPDIYNKAKEILTLNDHNSEIYKWFKGEITAIAIPKDVAVPKWILVLLDYNTIIIDNLSGFPLESIGISTLSGKSTKNTVKYTNLLKL